MVRRFWISAILISFTFAGVQTLSTVTAGATSPYLTPSAPLSMSIPSLKVKAKIIKLGLDSVGALEVPKTGDIAGWYKGSSSPGEIGPTIIVAHVDMNGKAGVFFRLKEMKIGDVVKVQRADKEVVTFIVTEISTFKKSKFPSEKIYGNLNFAGLRLITCGGKFDSKIRHYDSNVVVYAKKI